MLTYSMDNREDDTLYEYLYKKIKEDILKHMLMPGEKLPSKRALAKQLSISVITVENAYSQLQAEGYIYSKPKSGFFVSDIETSKIPTKLIASQAIKEEEKGRPDIAYLADFASNTIYSENFPFSIWTKIMREVMSGNMDSLLCASPSNGMYELRLAIAQHLLQFRGMEVNPDQIIVGAGTEYLYGLIIQLLGRNHTYAVEDPGYQKIYSIYEANQVKCVHVSMDSQGVDLDQVEETNADVLHISPSHHFPTGIITPVSRRYELLSWAAAFPERYIIEDEYDSEFRLMGRPIPSLQSIDRNEKVIYINTFSKTLSATIRVSYMVLPPSLMEEYRKRLSFYSCTVSNFMQCSLAHFISQGYLEKHINRMRNYYRTLRNQVLLAIKDIGGDRVVSIKEENAGLHFLVQVQTSLSDEELVEKGRKAGIHIMCLSQYYFNQEHATMHTLVINYSGTLKNQVEPGIKKLFSIL